MTDINCDRVAVLSQKMNELFDGENLDDVGEALMNALAVYFIAMYAEKKIPIEDRSEVAVKFMDLMDRIPHFSKMISDARRQNPVLSA